MNDNQCPICDATADIKEISPIDKIYFIKCLGECPPYEIPKWIASRIPEIHGRKPHLREAIRVFKKTHPDTIALIRPNSESDNKDYIEIVSKMS